MKRTDVWVKYPGKPWQMIYGGISRGKANRWLRFHLYHFAPPGTKGDLTPTQEKE